MKKIKAIFFDAGNTLVSPNPSFESVVFEVLDKLKIGHKRKEIIQSLPHLDDIYNHYYWNNLKFWQSPKDAAITWANVYSTWFESLGFKEESGYLGWELYKEFGFSYRWRVFQDVIPTLQVLRNKGFKLGVISNWDHRLSDIFKKMDIEKYFNFIISSASTKTYKPGKEIFDIAINEVNCNPKDVLFVGDHWLADILGAKKAGLNPIFINRNNSFHLLDCPEINSLDELFKFIE